MNIDYFVFLDQNIDMSYNSRSIKVLKGLEACRTRPGMYIGNTQDGSGLHHMIYEVLDNSIDEHLAKNCTEISIKIDKEGYATVCDNGRGIPVDIHESEGISAAIVIMTQLHAGGKFDQDSYKISGGLHGVGVSVVNALSDRLELTVDKDGFQYFVAFSKGDVVEDIRQIGPSKRHGTMVRFLPDATIFGDITFDIKIIENRIEQLSYLNPGLKISLEDERVGFKREFFQPEGIVAFVKNLMKSKEGLHEIIPFKHKDGNSEIDGAIVWIDNFYSEEIRCFTNTIPQNDGGTHLVGLKTALTRCVNAYIQKDQAAVKKMKDLQLTGEDIREGIICVLAVYMPEPQFASQTKDKLVSSSIRPIVEAGVSETLERWFEENPVEAKKIVQKITEAAMARDAARKSRDLIRNNKGISEFSLSMATKLAGCTQKDPTKAELFIVEGDSAGGSAKMARNRLFQAVLPLRGKILNVEKAGLNRMLADEGIRTLIAVMGTGIGETFDITKIRYNKIIIMTDADVDGSHILTLLITFFFKYMRPIIENGYLYVAQPPLYGIKSGQKMHYLLDDQALAEFLLERQLDKVQFNKISSKDDKRFENEVVISEGPVEVATIKEFVRALFSIASDIKSRGVVAQAFVAGKIDIEDEPENIYANLIKTLERIKPGKWMCENREEDDVFVYEVNGLTYRYPFAMKKLPVKYHAFIQKWSQFWDSDIQMSYNEELRAIVDPMQIHEIFSQKSEQHIQRYKGLGEMNPDDLAKTAMQSYLQVRYEDEAEAAELIEKLMSDDVEPRKKFIEEMEPLLETDD